jgi:hypothetical protein
MTPSRAVAGVIAAIVSTGLASADPLTCALSSYLQPMKLAATRKE